MWRRTVGFQLALLLASAGRATAQAPRIGVDRRVELMAILFKLAGNPEYNQNNFVQYNADIERHFGPFRNHEAVALARGLHERYNTGFSGVMGIAIRVTDPPELRARVSLDSLSADAWRFVDAARRFSVEARADAFFAAHRVLYDSADARLRRPVERDAPFEWIARFFGVPADRDFVVVPLLANSQTNFGNCVYPQGGRLECFSILGHGRTDSAGFPAYDESLVETLVHEITHGYANPLAAAHREEFERSAPRIYAAVADAMQLQAYDRWTSMVNESLVHATVARYLLAHKETERVQAFLRDERAGSWLWVEELSDLFGRYEADRRTHPTLASFMPRVIGYFDSLPDRVPAMQRRYDAVRPRVVSLSIENGSETVDPALREIVASFGPGMLAADGTLNRDRLASIIFKDPTQRARLEAIVHPCVFAEEERRCLEIGEKDPHAVVLFDAALLIETGAYKNKDRVIVVTADEQTQLSRIMARDHLTEAQARERIGAQMPLSEKIKVAHYVIDGTLPREQVQKEVQRIYKELKQSI